MKREPAPATQGDLFNLDPAPRPAEPAVVSRPMPRPPDVERESPPPASPPTPPAAEPMLHNAARPALLPSGKSDLRPEPPLPSARVDAPRSPSEPAPRPVVAIPPDSRSATPASLVAPSAAAPRGSSESEPPAYRWRQPVKPEEPAQRRVMSVAELTWQIKNTLERGFPRVLVRGEVSGFRGPNPRGHLYFAIKDSGACIDARIWASAAAKMKFKLRDGLSVVIEGSIELYEPQGRYALIVQRIEPAGEGALALAFQQLKEKLQAEGLFGENRKRPVRPIPFLPRRIGVVTSRTGAALQDFLRVLHQRHPRLSVVVCDSRVQGEGAADEVAYGIERLSRFGVDVIVVTRGGGSVEDLWTFNEERVARAIFASRVPVVSAVGHEVDFTIADFVADYRAPTPTAAAEKLAPVLADLELALATYQGRLRKAAERAILTDRQRLQRLAAKMADPRRVLAQKQLQLGGEADALALSMRTQLKQRRERLKQLTDRLARKRPQAQVSENRERLTKLKARLHAAMRERERRERQGLQKLQQTLVRVSPRGLVQAQRLRVLALKQQLERHRSVVRDQRRLFREKIAKLNAMSPLAVLSRGYAVAFRRDDGRLVLRASDVAIDSEIALRLAPGGAESLSDCEEIDARVTAVRTPKPSEK